MFIMGTFICSLHVVFLARQAAAAGSVHSSLSFVLKDVSPRLPVIFLREPSQVILI